MKELITTSFRSQAIAFPQRVDAMLAKIDTVSEAKDMLDKASVMKQYANRLKAGVEIEKPIAIGVLKIKAKLGELMPATPKQKTGRGNKVSQQVGDFSKNTVSAYRKIAKNQSKLDKYIEDEIEDVPSQAGFIAHCEKPHQAKTNGKVEWYTPPVYIAAAKAVMGTIDCDPASCKSAQKNVKAKKFFDESDDGLAQDWTGNIWLNPPYAAKVIDQFIDKLIEEVEAGNTKQAIVLINNATDTKWFAELMNVASRVCFTDHRIAFIDQSGSPVSGATQGQVFVYHGKKLSSFTKHFRKFGIIMSIVE